MTTMSEKTKKPTHGTFTYYRYFLTNKEHYHSGESGWAILHINKPLTIVDLTIGCTEKVFVVKSMLVGDTEYLLGTGAQPAEYYSPKLKERGFRPEEMQRGDTVVVMFKNVYADNTGANKGEPIDICAKVQQEREP